MPTRKYTTVSIPYQLYEKLERMIEGTGFSSVSEFVTYILREVVAMKERRASGAQLSQEELKELEEKLRALGYL
ncbi:MAG: ribbon-helix-helix domain-containing protein [Thermoproteus sp.]